MKPCSAFLGLLILACGEGSSSEETSSAIGLECPKGDPCFFVRNTNASGFGSLPQAIELANAQAGRNRIVFAIPGAGPHVIPASVVATDAVYIDGYSQDGAQRATASTPAVLQIVIDGEGVRYDGVYVDASDSHVTGLVVLGHPGYGIEVVGQRNVVEGCYVGTDSTGTAAGANGTGISVIGDSNLEGDESVVGGDTPAERNIISGNTTSYGEGVGIGLGSCDRCVVTGNYIGTDVTGTQVLGNDTGVMAWDGPDVVIGGTSPSRRNLISGNRRGVDLRGLSARVEGNYIGTDLTGTVPVGNLDGIVVNSGGRRSVIGGTASGAGNLISGNEGFGVQIWGDDNRMSGNIVGLDGPGSEAMPNIQGVVLVGLRNVVGGTTAAARNVISGNTTHGIGIQSSIDTPLPSGNLILGNYIGVDLSGTAAVGNGNAGVFLMNGVLNLIGGPGAAGNVISGNALDGVRLEDWSGASRANSIAGNAIGTDAAGAEALGNGGSGVRILGGVNNWVGGTLTGQGNRIAFNAEAGVAVNAGSGHAILGNSIADNSGLGIDLGADGVTASDGLGDADAGANALQNYPGITAISVSGGSTTVSWELRSAPSRTYRIELFASASCDASGFGEAERLLMAFSADTDAAGLATGQAVLTTAAQGEWVTGTASAILGPLGRNTSELGRCRRVP